MPQPCAAVESLRESARHRVAAAVALVGLLACAPAAGPGGPAPGPATAAPKTAEVVPEAAPCERIVRIEVAKSERLLRAHCARGAVVAMTAALGREPRGDKRMAGDLRTPEGLYRISGWPGPSRFHAFVPIDYPSMEDARRALAEGRLDARDHARIAAAHAQGHEPPRDTPLGGDIGFHGEGQRWTGESQHLDWTLGCIAVTDGDLDFLIARIAPGVPVEILP